MLENAQTRRADNLSMRARGGGSHQDGYEDVDASSGICKGRWGGNLAPCEARGGVRLRAVDPVLIALEVDGKCCIHDYGCEIIDIAVSLRQQRGKVCLVVPSLSARPSVCSPPVRSAPVFFFFPSIFDSLPT